MSELPPYSEAPPPVVPAEASAQTTNGRIAGAVLTCSIADMHHDYFKITRESATRYQLSLTVDPTPIYRVELTRDPTVVGDIVVLPVFSSRGAVAAVKFANLKKSKTRYEPVATVCAQEPCRPDMTWLPLVKASVLGPRKDCEMYRSSIPIVTVPGLKASIETFVWRFKPSATYFEMSSEWPLPYEPGRTSNQTEGDSRLVFARVTLKSSGKTYPEVIEIRRGGGLEFELTVVLNAFTILHNMNRLQ